MSLYCTSAILLVHVFLCNGVSSSLYGIYTGASWTETTIYTAQIDTTTGVLTNVTQDESFGGGSAFADGIAAIDQTNGIYYWANDYETPLLYGTDLIHKCNIAPTDLYLYTIMNIVVNQATSDALVLAIDGQSKVNKYIYRVSYPEGSAVIMAPFAPGCSYGAGAYNSDKNLLQYAAYNQTTASYVLLSYDLSSGALKSSIPFSGCTSSSSSKIFINYLEYDAATGQLYGGAIVGQSPLTYAVLTVDPASASCTSATVPSAAGIVTAWAYDPNASVMYYAIAPNGNPLLFGFNVRTGSQTANFKTRFLMESIAVKYQ